MWFTKKDRRKLAEVVAAVHVAPAVATFEQAERIIATNEAIVHNLQNVMAFLETHTPPAAEIIIRGKPIKVKRK